MRNMFALWLFLEIQASRARRRRRARAVPLVDVGSDVYWLSDDGPVRIATWKDPAA